jgi:hypothetical protein
MYKSGSQWSSAVMDRMTVTLLILGFVHLTWWWSWDLSVPGLSNSHWKEISQATSLNVRLLQTKTTPNAPTLLLIDRRPFFKSMSAVLSEVPPSRILITMALSYHVRGARTNATVSYLEILHIRESLLSKAASERLTTISCSKNSLLTLR